MRIDLQPPSWATHVLSDLTDWQRAPLPVDEVVPVDLPDDVYFEYAYLDADGERRPDPDNPNPRLNPWWPYASNLSGPQYRPDPLAQVSERASRGRLLRLEVDSRILDQSRRVLIYTPAGCADRALPLILFQDGKAYLGWGKVPQILDRLLEREEVEPAHLVFIPPQARTPEYFFNARYREFLLGEALPFVERRIACDGRRTAWGASLGGLLSAQLAWQAGDLFQQVVTQSGAFLFSAETAETNPFTGNEAFRSEVLASPPRPVRWRLDCGSLEWLLPSNEHLVAALVERGHEATLTVRNAGHNWVNWRNGIAAGLRFALGR